jgi:hypothetical protein
MQVPLQKCRHAKIMDDEEVVHAGNRYRVSNIGVFIIAYKQTLFLCVYADQQDESNSLTFMTEPPRECLEGTSSAISFLSSSWTRNF